MPSIGFLNEALDFVSNTTLPGVFFGINFTLYFLCTQLFYRQYHKASPHERRRVVFTFLYNSLMVLAVSLELGTNTRMAQQIFIEHGGIHGEPIKFANSIKENSVGELLSIVPSFVLATVNMILQIWRVWIIWAMSPYRPVATIFPIGFALASLAIDIYQRTLSTTGQDKLQLTLDTVLLTLNVASSLLVTLLLVGRIVAVRRRQNHLMGMHAESVQYTSIIAMLIESYALDAIWATATTICFALALEGNPVQLYFIFSNTGDQVTVIAFLLVTYRVLLGRAWTPETERQLSTIRWNHTSISEGAATGDINITSPRVSGSGAVIRMDGLHA